MTRTDSGRVAHYLLIAIMGVSLCAMGCKTKAQTGALAGAGAGALMGQAIGKNTTGTLVGAAVGTGVGYIIGNEMDKGDAKKEQKRREQAAATAAAATPPPVVPAPPETYIVPAWPVPTAQMQPFADTSWRVLSVTPAPMQKFQMMTLHFLPDGKLITTKVIDKDNVASDSETYRVVGDTLIINDTGYLVNAKYSVDGSTITITNQNVKMILERVGDGA